jgi:hypothetical protein
MSTDTRGELWEWSWHISKGPPGFTIHDRADTKAEAQATIEREWGLWLEAAGLKHA